MTFKLYHEDFRRATKRAMHLLDDPTFDINAKDDGGFYQSLFMTTVVGCCEHLDYSVMDKMMKDDRLDINYTNINHVCAMTNALWAGNTEVLKKLLSHPRIKIFPEEGMRKDLFTNPIFAAAHHSSKCLRILLDDERVDVIEQFFPALWGALSYNISGREGSLRVIFAQHQIPVHDKSKTRSLCSPARKLTIKRGFAAYEGFKMLEDFLGDPAGTQSKLRKELGYNQFDAAVLFVAIQRPKLRITKGMGKKFFSVARRLPPELQMRLCNLSYGVNSDFITDANITKARKFLYSK